MKKATLINQPLSEVIAGMGHGDLLVIGDAGLPIPPATRRIDLAVTRDVPRFLDVVRAVLTELQVEEALVAGETWQVSPHVGAGLRDALGPIPVRTITHEELKALSARAVAVVRTGEHTPYANVVLKAGVTF
ncbi:D-ribose pyranase [Caldinitratiruptor microaerophilus]|uniref:D-ribose pyranase n=1 Tax=Caldinitratiruptor microaerophilus TaxID=671077 RepID=A0AA35CN46_9FIRM|nr:D-ribose pyranase [Caldinitratiruptor microaerophilus]BDG62354.1 D-ribose pyranase [Caldinitratiruptor microaerophilus]